MTTVLAIISLVLAVIAVGAIAKLFRVQKQAKTFAEAESERLRKHYEAEALRIHSEAEGLVADAQKHSQAAIQEAQQRAEAQNQEVARAAQAKAEAAISEARSVITLQHEQWEQESARQRELYETELRKTREAADALVIRLSAELEPLRKYGALAETEADFRKRLADKLQEAAALRAEAEALLESSRNAAESEKDEASRKAKETRKEADQLLDNAIRNAADIVKRAELRAAEIGKEGYAALRDKDVLEQAVKAIWNVVEGYGDRYIIPSRSLLDDLASNFGHTEAGNALKAARDLTRRMVERGLAADCNYVEADRRERAIRFVTDAFNGRVDAILSRVKHDNYGTLEQEIRDAYSLVNLNGLAFRDARVLPAYLDARLAELKWAVVVQELKREAREEQRRIQEQMREDEKVRRESERAIREAQDKEEAIRRALEKARSEAETATAQQKEAYDAQIASLKQRLAEAEAVREREVSMAQLTRAGNVYICSNLGSFGEDVLKIGMTRRRDPMERIWELSDASVPFDFDVHAMIYTEDAPALENLLHSEFQQMRVNKVNERKEFFRIPLQRVREIVAAKGLKASFTMAAEAREYRESLALEGMDPQQRERFLARHELHMTTAHSESNKDI